MLTVRRLTGDDVEAYRDIRLEALEIVPHAFASTLAREQAFRKAGQREEHDART